MRLARPFMGVVCAAALSAGALDQPYDPQRQEIAAPEGFRKHALSGRGPFYFHERAIRLSERDLRADAAQPDAGHAFVDIALGDTTVSALQRQGVRLDAAPDEYAKRYWGAFDFGTLENLQTGNSYFYIVESIQSSTAGETRLRLITLSSNGAVTAEDFTAGETLATPFRAQFFRIMSGVYEYLARREACFAELVHDDIAPACGRIGADLAALARGDGDPGAEQLGRALDTGWYRDRSASGDAAVRLAAMHVIAVSNLAGYTREALTVIESGMKDQDGRVREMAVAALASSQMVSRENLNRGVQDVLLSMTRNDAEGSALTAAQILLRSGARQHELRDACLARLAVGSGDTAGARFVRIVGDIEPPDRDADRTLWELARGEAGPVSVAAATVLAERESPSPELAREILRLVSSDAHFCDPELVKRLPAIGAEAKSILPGLRALRIELLAQLETDRAERTRVIYNDGFTLDVLDKTIAVLESD